MLISLIISSGLMAGIYGAFSMFIMRSLATLDPLPAAKAMNAINTVIVKTLFLPLFFGSVVLYCVALIDASINPFEGSVALLALAAAVYIVGMFVVTVMCNVPMNNKLQTLADNHEQLTAYWPHYLKYWTRLNHVRTICCLLATAALCFLL